ncbi:MAG TPA: molybdate ABC transporter substrate-binding protein [Burkholderiaceae bacterium]|jgi:molybdenum ABC transporter molybdate-binding protein
MRISPIAVAVLFAAMTTGAKADGLVLYGAGSLREAMGQVALEFGKAHDLVVTTQFGNSGSMRERIEKGDKVDVFTSADVGHARKLLDDGRADVMVMFARNRVCLLSPAKFGATTETALQKMVSEGVRIGMSPPKADPLGDYTVQLFEKADQVKAGSEAVLQARAVVLQSPPAGPAAKSGDTDVDAIQDGRIDASIVYCSISERYARLLPSATVVAFPPELQVGPEYALAVLKNARPEAYQLALTILSAAGQKILADRGFIPVALPH